MDLTHGNSLTLKRTLTGDCNWLFMIYHSDIDRVDKVYFLLDA